MTQTDIQISHRPNGDIKGWIHAGEISENRSAQNKRRNYVARQRLIRVQTDQILLKDKLKTINF